MKILMLDTDLYFDYRRLISPAKANFVKETFLRNHILSYESQGLTIKQWHGNVILEGHELVYGKLWSVSAALIKELDSDPHYKRVKVWVDWDSVTQKEVYTHILD